MAFLSSSGGSMAEINITPLVDVMLVLLVIFMVTVPAISHPIPAYIGKGNSDTPALEPIRIHIDASGALSCNGSPVTLEVLRQRFDAEAARGIVAGGRIDPSLQPMVKIDADSASEYELLAQVLARANNAGLVRVGFVD
jgi:biopolymer transport protein ExbD